MNSGYCIGLDIGTTNTKICVCDNSGKIIMESSQHTEIVPTPTGGEIEPANFIQSVHSLLGKTIRSAEDWNIGPLRCIGITGMAESGCLIDYSGSPTNNIRLWYDSRGQSEAKLFMEQYESQILAVTGIRPGNVPSVYKVMALKNERPLTGLRWCGVPELAALSLTYRWYTDRSLAVRCGAYNLNTNGYAHKIMELFGIDPMMFPPCINALSQDVPLAKGFREEWGLTERVRVVVAGHDDIVAAFSLKPQDGEFIASEGTAESLTTIVRKMPSPLVCGKKHIPISPYYEPESWALLTGIGTTGNLLAQLKDQTGLSYAEIDQLAADNAPYPEGIAQAEIVKNRISELHIQKGFTPSQYIHAVYDLMTAAFSEKVLTLASISGTPSKIRFVGGGAALTELCRRKAEAAGNIPFRCETRSASAALGAAMIAMQGEG